MSIRIFFKEAGITSNIDIINIFIIINTFIWYFHAFEILRELIKEAMLSYLGALIVWTFNFLGAAILALIGATLTDKIDQSVWFLRFWIFLGIISTLIPIFADVKNMLNILIFSFMLGVSFGLGMPVCMGYYADHTNTLSRARLGGLIVFLIGVGAFLLSVILPGTLIRETVVLTIWRGLGLISLFIIKPFDKFSNKIQRVSYVHILGQRSFLLYLIPWIMFCLVNYLTIPVTIRLFGEDVIRFSMVIENALIGAFAIIGGFLSDSIGRKRVIIMGFVMLGLGYAILGVYPGMPSWYFYTVIDGIAWGIFFTLFIITIWGDLAYGMPSKKYYAIGGLPYLLSNFLRLMVGSWIAETVSAYTVFSFASFFLFLAVIPLMYAPETLPEKEIRRRELRKYVEKAKKIREKYAKEEN